MKLINEHYLSYVRKLPCLVCQQRPVDADHLIARGWEQFKRNDYCAIPLCRRHHQERGQIGNEKFQTKYGIENLWKEAFSILTAYLKAHQPYPTSPPDATDEGQKLFADLAK